MENLILELFKDGYSFPEIQNRLNLDSQDMYTFLNNINNKINERYHHIKFYEDAKRRYSKDPILESGVITELGSDTYTSLIISDTHFGSNEENVKLLDIVYNFCIKNNIHNIYHLGDVIDGTTGKPKYLNPNEQVEHVINDYPYDNSILNFILLGNHDLDIIGEELPLHEAIQKNRKDMVCLGYGSREFFIKNDSFILKHAVLIDKMDPNYNQKIILKGHSHQMKTYDNLINHCVHAPALSNLQIAEGTIPGFLTMELNFKYGYIIECIINHYGILGDKIIFMNSAKINLKGHKKVDTINREEPFIKIKR